MVGSFDLTVIFDSKYEKVNIMRLIKDIKVENQFKLRAILVIIAKRLIIAPNSKLIFNIRCRKLKRLSSPIIFCKKLFISYHKL